MNLELMTDLEHMTGLECVEKLLRRYYGLYFKAVREKHDGEEHQLILEDIKCLEKIQQTLEYYGRCLVINDATKLVEFLESARKYPNTKRKRKE